MVRYLLLLELVGIYYLPFNDNHILNFNLLLCNGSSLTNLIHVIFLCTDYYIFTVFFFYLTIEILLLFPKKKNLNKSI